MKDAGGDMMDEKKRAGEEAAGFVTDRMVVGLGTGSTVAHTILRLGEMVKDGMEMLGVSTSDRTTALAKAAGIPLARLEDVERIDVCIDGADEVDPAFQGIKGGGGALLFEKLVAEEADMVVWVVTQEKLVERLGAFPLPLEVVPFSHRQVLRKLEAMGLSPELRRSGGAVFTTDGGNHIIDLRLGRIDDPCALHRRLKLMPGVIETGLFLDQADVLVIGKKDAVEVVRRDRDGGPCGEGKTQVPLDVY